MVEKNRYLLACKDGIQKFILLGFFQSWYLDFFMLDVPVVCYAGKAQSTSPGVYSSRLLELCYLLMRL